MGDADIGQLLTPRNRLRLYKSDIHGLRSKHGSSRPPPQQIPMAILMAATIEERITRLAILMAATIEERITHLEQALLEQPPTAQSWDNLLNRVSALEDRLLAADDQPTADQLSRVTLQAEIDAWQRVNPGATMADWTVHFARTRGLGVAA